MTQIRKRIHQERRRADNLYLSILVDVGVTYQRTLGPQSAAHFLRNQDIPPTVSERVLGQDTPRRMTDWEIRTHRNAIQRKVHQ